MTFALDDPFGESLEDVRFCLRIDATQAHLNWNARLRAEQRDRLAPLAAGVSPNTLLVPPPGLVAVSGNLNKPLVEVWRALGAAFGSGDEAGLFSESRLTLWETWPEEGPPSVPQLIASVLGPLGPGWRIALQEVDLNEWFPVPVFAGTFDLPQGDASGFLGSLPSAPDNALAWESYPRYDAAAGTLRIPMIAGPSLRTQRGALRRGAAGLQQRARCHRRAGGRARLEASRTAREPLCAASAVGLCPHHHGYPGASCA